MIKLIAPDGAKLRHLRSGREYTQVICEESQRSYYVVVGSAADPITQTVVEGVTLESRVNDLEDAVVELAEIITEG